MDPETQALLDRSRKRRELLNQRFATMPEAAPRKRRTPVYEEDSVEKILTEQKGNENDDGSRPYYDSPKRQCLRNVERYIKPDTPAIQGVHSRIKDLAQTRETDDQENVTAPIPVPRKSVSSPPLDRKVYGGTTTSPSKKQAVDVCDTPSNIGRKGRFAALAQNIGSWEDDLSHHVLTKKEEKNPTWQASKDTEVKSPSKGLTQLKQNPTVDSCSPRKRLDGVKQDCIVPASSPKKTPAPPVPKSSAVNTFSRSSPLRASKVELNRSPKPFTSTSNTGSGDCTLSKTASAEVLTSNKEDCPVVASKSLEVLPSQTPVKAVAGHVTSSDAKLNLEDPTNKPVSQRFAAWEKKVQTPKGRPSIEPSKRPMSAKLAHFEKEIVNNTPNKGLSHSTRVEKTQRQVCTPALSASTPASSISRPQDCDPSELPISQRMSRMQEKLANSPVLRGNKAQDEPTSYPVGARMSAWENVASSNMSSEVKKVNPELATGHFTPQKPPAPPPPVPSTTKNTELTPQKSFKDSLKQKVDDVLCRKVQTASTAEKRPSPSKAAVNSPSKVQHSPSKLSKGTKAVQQKLIQKSQESNTTCSAIAAQSRAARLAELEALQNRWKNGVLRDDSSSDESKPISSEAAKKTPVSGRREEARNKARQDFANKISEIGLDCESEKKDAAATPKTGLPKTPVSAKCTLNQTSSIYALIKKKDVKQAEENVIKSTPKVHFNDSFDESDDESMRKVPRSASLRAAQNNPVEPETFKKPTTPKKMEQLCQEMETASSSDIPDDDSVASSRTSLEIDDDDISLKGFVSEAVRRESIRFVTQPKHASQSSLDSYDDETQSESNDGMEGGASSHLGGYRPDNESMDDDDEDDTNAGDVGDLLDEAMDDSSDAYDPDMDPNNVVLRKKANREPQEEEYDPDMDPNNVVMRRKPQQQLRTEAYDPDMDPNNVVLRRKPQPTNQNSPVIKKTRSHARAMDSTEDEDDSDRPYSLSEYRKSVNVKQHIMEPVVRQSKYCGQRVVEEDISMPQARHKDDKTAVQDRMKELQDLVQQEQSVIMQTSNALNKCCIGNAYFEGSAEQVECNRLLLIACQKRQVYMKEIQRLKQTSVLNPGGSGPQGSLTISDLRLPLKKDFVKKIGTSHDNTTHFFILLIRNGCQLICTQMLSTHDSMMRGSLDFPNLIKINGIAGDFKLTVDIYGMSVSKEMTLKDKKRKTPKKGKGFGTRFESPGGPMAVRTTSFTHVSSVDLTMENLDKTSFHLDRLAHLSPLYGQLFMRLKCVMEANVEEKGFLTMFDDVSGFGAWHRRWCVLSTNKLCVWKYPDDETRKDPMTVIDLKRCVTEKVGLVPRDICARPNTFEMVTVRQPLKGEHDTLVSKTHRTVTTVRHQMSADTKEERIMWCNKINKTLANLRTWNSGALRPSGKQQQPSSSSYYH